MRLDKWLVLQNIVSSRSKAKDLIFKNAVLVNQQICSDMSYLIQLQDQVEIISEQLDHYVSRSAHKLKAALIHFAVVVKDKIALDIGMSTGGFTQVLLEEKAKEVIGVDVGHDQLHASLKKNPKIKVYEGINVREGLPFTDQFEIIVVDVSFISVLKILGTLNSSLAPNGEMLILIKPQFEQSYEQKKKLVLSKNESSEIAHQCRDAILKTELSCSALFEVPLKGKDGNQEYFVKCTLI